MALETEPWDAAEYLTDDASVLIFLIDALECADAADITDSLATVIRAKGGLDVLAARAGIRKEDLEDALHLPEGPNLAGLLLLFKALGLKLSAIPAGTTAIHADVRVDETIAA